MKFITSVVTTLLIAGAALSASADEVETSRELSAAETSALASVVAHLEQPAPFKRQPIRNGSPCAKAVLSGTAESIENSVEELRSDIYVVEITRPADWIDGFCRDVFGGWQLYEDDGKHFVMLKNRS